jgi:hypothetical protein
MAQIALTTTVAEDNSIVTWYTGRSKRGAS